MESYVATLIPKMHPKQRFLHGILKGMNTSRRAYKHQLSDQFRNHCNDRSMNPCRNNCRNPFRNSFLRNPCRNPFKYPFQESLAEPFLGMLFFPGIPVGIPFRKPFFWNPFRILVGIPLDIRLGFNLGIRCVF